jgi:ubiquinol-cytochrome c reductase cytochrome c subunit
MMIRFILFAAALLTAPIGGASAQAPASAQATASPANAENGKRLFMKHTCYFCHGTVGQGGIAGARVSAVARNAQGFIRYVRRPSGQMPAYTDKILSDEELTDIFTYLKSLPAAKPPREIPLLDQLKDRPF